MTLALLPPQSLDAEESVLGAMLLAEGAIDKVIDTGLSADAFYRTSHGCIFTAILSLYGRGEAADAITVVDELTKTGKIEKAGGVVRVHELAGLAPAASNAAHWAKIVREAATRRELIEFANDVAQKAYEGGSAKDLVAEADGQLLRLQASMRNKQSSVFTGKDLAKQFRYRMEHPEQFESTVPPPFSFLQDQIINGQLHILAGYQGVGKTALVWQFATAAAESGKKVGIWTLEMTPDQLGDRFITSHGVPSVQVRKGRVAGEYQGKLAEALTALEKLDVEIINDSFVTPESIRRQQRQSKYDLVLIDHLHRFPIKNPAHIRVELSEVVRKITNISIESNAAIVLLSQLTRGTQHDPFPRPTRVQLKETGAIENDASAIWFIWRKWDGFRFENEAEFITDKNRHGADGTFKRLHFRASQVRFTESLI